MKRHYYISDNLDDLEKVEDELEQQGVTSEQIHVLSDDPADIDRHHLHAVDSLSRSDVVHSGFTGLIMGMALAAITFFAAITFGIHNMITTTPIIFVSLVIIGFCTWEGGLWGIQKTNRVFDKFKEELRKGRHVFFVDVRNNQENVFREVVGHHPDLIVAGDGNGTPSWLVRAHVGWNKFTHWGP